MNSGSFPAHEAVHAAGALLQLPHHVVQAGHAAHLLEDPRVHHFGHLLVQFGHLGLVDVFGHVAAFEQALDAAHFFYDGCKLGVLSNEVFHVPFCDPSALGHSGDARRLLGEQFCAIAMVEFAFVHGVHNGHEAFQFRHRFLLAAFRHQILRETWYHALKSKKKS